MLQNTDDGNASVASHFDVLRRVSNIDATAGLKAEMVNCEQQLHRMRLAMGHSVAEDTHGKKWLQSKCANLLPLLTKPSRNRPASVCTTWRAPACSRGRSAR
jgi:hypothetical protein